jgi:hypothetical protein
VIELKSGTRILDCRWVHGSAPRLQWLSSIVETVLEQAPGGLSGETMSGGGFQRVRKQPLLASSRSAMAARSDFFRAIKPDSHRRRTGNTGAWARPAL